MNKTYLSKRYCRCPDGNMIDLKYQADFKFKNINIYIASVIQDIDSCRYTYIFFFLSFLKGLNARMHTNDLSTLWSEESSKKISDNNKYVFNKDVFHTLIPKWRYIYNRSFIIETGARYLYIFCWPEFYFVWRIIYNTLCYKVF